MLQDVPEVHRKTMVLLSVVTFILGGLIGYTLGLKERESKQAMDAAIEAPVPTADNSGGVEIEVYKNPFEDSANPFR